MNTTDAPFSAAHAGRLTSAIDRLTAVPGTSAVGPVLCLHTRTLRVASAFAPGGMLRTDVCGRPRGHKGEHRA